MIQKDILRRLLTGFYFLQFSVVLLWITHYSYRAKELLACWLLFCSVFAVLALVLLGTALAGYAGHHLVKWVRVAKAVIPELVVSLAQIPQEVSATPPIFVAGTLPLPVALYAAANTLNTETFLIIADVPSDENNVLNGTDSNVRAAYYV